MRTYLPVELLWLVFILGATSPGRAQPPADAATFQIRQTVFAPSLHVNLDSSYQTWSGTFVRDLVPGNGIPQGLLSKVRIKFRIWLADGQLLADGTIPNLADTVTFELGRGALIRGLDEGSRGMRLGGVRQLIIPSIAGWGPAGHGNIPPNAVVVAEVALIQVPNDSARVIR